MGFSSLTLAWTSLLTSVLSFVRLLIDSSHSHAPVPTRVIGPGLHLKSGRGSAIDRFSSLGMGKTLSRSNNGATRSNAPLGPVRKPIATLKYKI